MTRTWYESPKVLEINYNNAADEHEVYGLTNDTLPSPGDRIQTYYSEFQFEFISVEFYGDGCFCGVCKRL